MRICFLSAEYSPFAKTGGLGDVSAALTRHLARRGHDLRVFIPLHGQMDLRGVDRHPVDFLQGLSVRVGPQKSISMRTSSSGPSVNIGFMWFTELCTISTSK